MSHWPLFDACPALADQLAPRALCDLPTPVQPLPAAGQVAWIKRDDLTHPQYGGNKMRKLEFVAAELQARHVRRVYTFGATGTNAGVAAALLCRELGIHCTVFTFDQPDSPTVRKNQSLMKHYGAELVHTGALWRTALTWYMHPRRLDPRSYFLFAGCSNPVATFGYVNAAFELRAQVSLGECPMPAEIVVAAGSAATLAGLTLGCALAGLPTRVVGVRVAPAKVGPFDACTAGVTRKMMAQALATLAAADSTFTGVHVPDVDLRDDWYGDGYGVPTLAGDAATRIAASDGIPLEPTYSAKAFAAFLDRLASVNGPVLFWNTYSSRALPEALTGVRA
ncbi:MAG: 1-aminocyclopropane-1-carboxylate deaminase/D-cysteine desulfhydrase [Gammaproteobacteria bacterium]